MDSSAQEKESNEPDSPTPEKPRRLRKALRKILTWFVAVSILWWLLALAIPGMPSPLYAAKEGLGFVKDISDDVYFLFNKERLQKAGDKISAETSEGDYDTVRSDVDRLSNDRRAKLPALSLHEDSALRATMQTISNAPMIGGKVINILLMGIDSRLGARDARADAIHLFTINPDSGVIDIMSVPRDTYCDLGYPDTTTFNIITNARALGYPGFMRRVEELCKRGPIKYYAEVGFSQALGVLEVLGYKDPVSTLKFLRARKTLPAGDIQRSHNQAVFLRQNLIDKFSLLTGATGDLLLTAGLNFVTTNLTKEMLQGLFYRLAQKGFPRHRSDAVRVRMLPMYKIRLKEMTADSLTIHQTLKRSRDILGDDGPTVNVAQYLRNVNRKALADSSRSREVINKLSRLVEQHAWIQVQNQKERAGIRDTMLFCLGRAYRKAGNAAGADRLEALRKSEDTLLQNKAKSK
jgi:anionic cell wall polymer biosynthesis LytR-Cps2A-Psr (LCP) family protein